MTLNIKFNVATPIFSNPGASTNLLLLLLLLKRVSNPLVIGTCKLKIV